MSATPLAIVDAGVDYLTCSYKPSANIERLRHFILRAKYCELKAGERESPWGSYGYMGSKVGGLEYGWRDDGVLVRMSGPTAQRWWRRFAYLASNCSRIDLQTTYVWDEPVDKTLRRHFRQMRKWTNARKKAPEPKLFVGLNGPETLYSGKRTSELYLRAYNRELKMKSSVYHGHLRYEAELKDDLAWRTMSAMVQKRVDLDHIIGRVLEIFRNRGCSLPTHVKSFASLRCKIRKDDASKRLAWLENAVRPTVQSLIESGHRDRVLDALGLSVLDLDQMVH